MSDPVTRREQLLSAIATGGDIISPITREEMYLAYLAGDTSVVLPEPITRKEQFLYQACLNGGGGGGTEITDGIVVKARDADGYATEVDFYGSEVKVRQFGSDNIALFTWSKLAFINFKNTITSIGVGGLRNSSIQIEIPGTVVAIGDYAFSNTKIATATIPNGCTLGNACFSGAQSMTYYQDAQPADNNYYQNTGVLANCKALIEATIGSVGHAVNKIRNNTFNGCSQTGLTITIYTTGTYADTALTNIRNGATNATIIIKDSTTGETIVTSTP